MALEIHFYAKEKLLPAFRSVIYTILVRSLLQFYLDFCFQLSITNSVVGPGQAVQAAV